MWYRDKKILLCCVTGAMENPEERSWTQLGCGGNSGRTQEEDLEFEEQMKLT
jgi:hypothetical protein